MLGMDHPQSLEGEDVPDVQQGLVRRLPADCLGGIEENQGCNSVFVASVESLAVEGGVIDDDQFANKVENSFGLVYDKNCVVFMEGLNPKDKIQFELET